jgi:hypothetical protein
LARRVRPASQSNGYAGIQSDSAKSMTGVGDLEHLLLDARFDMDGQRKACARPDIKRDLRALKSMF